jgi:hypothetical protein
MPARKRNKERDRLSSSLASSFGASLGGSEGGYELSSAYLAPERRRFLGAWSIEEHSVDGRPYIEAFAASASKEGSLLEPSYAAIYDFRDSICVKKVLIGGLLDLSAGRAQYSYRMSVALSWELGRGCMLVRPELGFQSTSLDGRPAAVKELAATGERLRIAYRFEGETLVLEEGTDLKRLVRCPT